MNKVITNLLLLVSVVVMGSCASQKKVTYLQGIPDEYEVKRDVSYDIKIQPDDMISIVVNSRDPKLAQMFNLSMVAYQTSGYTSSQNRVLGYLVNKDGEINFPQLGVIKAEGMTRDELTKYITNQLVSKGYVTDAVVTIQYLNFKISVMGEVSKPGTFSLDTDRITLLDAISMAGDLTIYGMRDRVKIIREHGDKTTISTVDLRSGDLITSPFYYLQQNDIVYVEPNRAKSGQREINSNRTVGTFASVMSVVLSAISIIIAVIL